MGQQSGKAVGGTADPAATRDDDEVIHRDEAITALANDAPNGAIITCFDGGHAPHGCVRRGAEPETCTMNMRVPGTSPEASHMRLVAAPHP